MLGTEPETFAGKAVSLRYNISKICMLSFLKKQQQQTKIMQKLKIEASLDFPPSKSPSTVTTKSHFGVGKT